MPTKHIGPSPSVVVAAGSGENGDIRRHPKFKSGLTGPAFPDVTTLYHGFQRGLRVNPDGDCLGFRKIKSEEKDAAGKTVRAVPLPPPPPPPSPPPHPSHPHRPPPSATPQKTTYHPFTFKTYAQVQAEIDAVGSAMVKRGMAPPNDTGHRLVGLYSKNRYEWVVAEQACHAFGFADVPLYDTLGHEAIVFVLSQTQMASCFCDAAGVPKLLDAKKGGALPAFKFVVSFEAPDAKVVAAGAAAGVTVVGWDALLAEGKAAPAPHAPPKPDDLAFICYTSGTTGMPKGAMILHRNIIADSSSAVTLDLGLHKTDVHLSYLPLAHIFERLVQAALFMLGASIGFYHGNTLELTDDLTALRPTLFPSVPRLYNKIYDKIMAGAQAGGIKTFLFNKAFASKEYYLDYHNTVRHSVWDKIVFSKVAARVGLDRVRVLLTGSAPIAGHVLKFLRIAFSATLCEGYGQTECSAAATLTDPGDQASLGHVGGPLPCNEVKLVSVGEMGYNVTDTAHGREVDAAGAVVNPGIVCVGRGEVCYRGANVFAGYYKDPEKTKEAVDKDGWLHSGDIGLWDANGCLRIVDRKKNIFKLSQGEYVAAEKIENVYIKANLVGAAFVYGDSLHSVLVAVICPDEAAGKAWAAANGHAGATLKDLCGNAAFKKEVEKQMEEMAKEAKLQGFEKARGVHLESEPWTPDDILTPSFKLKRADAQKKCVQHTSTRTLAAARLPTLATPAPPPPALTPQVPKGNRRHVHGGGRPGGGQVRAEAGQGVKLTIGYLLYDIKEWWHALWLRKTA
jgi:long-chain acyl-CoA synthetase